MRLVITETTVGDLSGSGVAELLVAAPRAGTDFQGWVWVFEGI